MPSVRATAIRRIPLALAALLIVFLLVNHDNAFIIEPAFSGIVKTNIVLDREIRDTYRLKVIATDEGVPQMTGTATIRIHIVDVNDNQPTFPPHSIISVSEGKSFENYYIFICLCSSIFSSIFSIKCTLFWRAKHIN